MSLTTSPDFSIAGMHFRKGRDVAAREDVFADEGAGRGRRAAAADRMQQHDAVRLQHLRAFVEEGAVVVDADMLEHADRDDAVEALGNVAVVLDLEMHVVVEALGLRRARSRPHAARSTA